MSTVNSKLWALCNCENRSLSLFAMGIAEYQLTASSDGKKFIGLSDTLQILKNLNFAKWILPMTCMIKKDRKEKEANTVMA